MIYVTARRARRRLLRTIGAYRPPQRYQEQFAERAAHTCDITGQKILVVGASTGEDCKLFVDYGAAEVHGLDVTEDVGSCFQHPRVSYHKAGIERSGLADGYFDLVFAVATMEHVPDIKAGFAEMARVTRPGGYVFSSASPLWQSPYGHHMGCFEGHPWVHLVFSRDELIAYAKANGVTEDRGYAIEGIVDYMLDPAFFNMRPAQEYVEACGEVAAAEILQNDLTMDAENLLDHPLGRRALEMGFERHSLLAVTHTFIARKRARAP